MTRTCDLERANCDEEATYRLTLISPDKEFLPMTRYCCEEHLEWYEKAFGVKRGYDIEKEVVSYG